MRLILIRHPEPEGASGVCYGRTDLPVSKGVLDLAGGRLVEALGEPAVVCVSSPLCRCAALARRLADDVILDDRLVELDFGAWEGRRWDDIDRDEFDSWAVDYVHRRVPGGESWVDVSDRVGSFLSDLRTSNTDQVVAVTHAGVIRAILAVVLDIALEQTWRIAIPFGCVVTVELGTKGQDDRLIGIT